MNKRKLYGVSREVPVISSDIEFISWIKRGKTRSFVFSNMKENVMPSELVSLLSQKDGRKSSSHYAEISRALAELKSQKLIVCLNPKAKTGKLYNLSERGKKLKKLI